MFTVIAAEAPFPYPPPLPIQQLPRGPPLPPPIAINAIRNNYPPAASYGPPPLAPIVTKNVYVHLPPNDDEIITPPQIIPPVAPKKHYKLIFIKAPEPPRFTPPIIPPNIPDEHKTLVYVLVKKPEPQRPVEVPIPVPTEPSKPEVYFIKYKGPNNTPAQGYGPPIAPKPEYGPPSGEYGPPAF